MLPWSRSSNSSAASLPSTTTSLPSHRRGSSSLSSSSSSTLASSSNKLKKARGGGKGGDDSLQEEEPQGDDDCWDEQSDDEQTVAALALGSRSHSQPSLSGLHLDSNNSSTTTITPTQSQSTTTTTRANSTSPTSPPPPAVASPSSWSFNPFTIIAPSPKSPPPPPPQPPLPGPQAVAQALASSSSSTRPQLQPQPSTTTAAGRGGSYLANASQVQAEADRKEQAVEDGEGEEDEESSKEKTRRGSTYQMEQWKKAIKPDVLELVKDPISLLTRLSADVPPPPTPSFIPPSPITPSHARRSSLASLPSHPTSDDSEDDSPSSGYVQLDATGFGSGGPEVVDLSKEEDPEEREMEESAEKGRERRRRRKFFEVLGGEEVDLAQLRSLAWAGIPSELRPMAWQLLLGYLPTPSTRRLSTLARKRQEYADAVRLAFSRGVKGLDAPIWHQISIDVPRTNSGVQLWRGEGTQRSLERILYVWAIRHPASGYVQGINDLVTPFFQVFLGSYIDTDPESYDVSALPPSVLEALEADSFWCLSKLLDGIQDNYIFAQPGIQRQVKRMRELCERVDAPLAHHLEDHSVEFIQFAFRWMNCLLMREMSVKCIVRMWDTYLAEGGDAFSEFHLYVCLAFLVKWSDQLREMDFQSIIIFLQSLPTQDWTDKNIELLLSEAFMWSRTFEAR
ncbi:rab-GTPase-TBC domain-domain-containing protein [Leucosporidium creatinivorum]|uniref:Rab-GTPase-TBC domain-domain-containing protein n=1 Tax=Leucosporidium creatinivorum TaxID=106004 RepID=A0A1Y2F062_9BASI|nr:rab-GTPase-TBC domain-domain-containing protein [Leucosporidium creatinivorum]